MDWGAIAQTLLSALPVVGFAGVVVEMLRRSLDARQRVNQARGKLIAAVTKFEIAVDGLDKAFGTGGTTTDVSAETAALEELGVAIGEARLELSQEIIEAAFFAWVQWDHDLDRIHSGRYPSFVWPQPGDPEVDSLEHLLGLLDAKSPRRFRALARSAEERLPKVPQQEADVVPLSPVSNVGGSEAQPSSGQKDKTR